jgi:acetylornithine aminotransferase/acetylornithine/N-succinyldiaminopimelate aminotransferase
MKSYAPPTLTLVRGRGAQVWDDKDKAYLDFTSGIAVCALGHCHPKLVAALQRQAGELIHVSNLFRNPNQGELARRLVGYAGPGRVFFCNSGAEANEAMIKLAHLHGQKKAGVEGKCIKIIGANYAFHGRTYGSMSATPQEKIQKGFRPMLPGFAFAELNDLKSFASLVDEDTAAILVETIQGESGVNPCTAEFLKGLRELCDRNNLLLLIDEVQCGVGRSGTFFAYEQLGVRPDAVSMAKGLGGGVPIGAIWVDKKSSDLFTPGSHGTTFGGTPLACAAALAVLDTIEQEKLLAHVREESALWIRQLKGLASEFPSVVLGVRGMGFMVGLQLASDPVPITAALREAGLLTCGAGHNVFRLLPPLTATREELNRSVEIIRSVLKARA